MEEKFEETPPTHTQLVGLFCLDFFFSWCNVEVVLTTSPLSLAAEFHYLHNLCLRLAHGFRDGWCSACASLLRHLRYSSFSRGLCDALNMVECFPGRCRKGTAVVCLGSLTAIGRGLSTHISVMILRVPAPVCGSKLHISEVELQRRRQAERAGGESEVGGKVRC